MDDHPLTVSPSRNHGNTTKQQHVAQLFLKVFVVMAVLGGWAYGSNSRIMIPPPDSAGTTKGNATFQVSGVLATSSINNDTKPYSYSLEKCIPCNAQETKELVDYVPGLIIPGAQKGGTTFLYHLLGQHPDVADYRQESHVLDNTPNVQAGSVHQCKIWREYKKLYDPCKSCKPSQLFVDKTPKYLWMSHCIPQRLACVFPEPVKILVILRNPTQRTFSQYQMHMRKFWRFANGTDDVFMDLLVSERTKLETCGVFPGLEKEVAFQAWKRYHDGAWKTEAWRKARTKHIENNLTLPEDVMAAMLSRGLYVLQLTHWIDTLSDLWGVHPDELVQNYFLILDNDEVIADIQGTMDRILDFAGLAPHHFNVEGISGSATKIHSYSALTHQEQDFLDDFFRPYNAELHRLLEPHGIEIGFAKEAAASGK